MPPLEAASKTLQPNPSRYLKFSLISQYPAVLPVLANECKEMKDQGAKYMCTNI